MTFRRTLLMAILLMGGYTYGQQGTTTLPLYQDSLIELGSKMVNDTTTASRIRASQNMARMLIRALKTPNSFRYGFDSLKMISIRYSPDQKFRIFSWHVLFDDGSYRYYGAIQVNSTDGKLVLHGLSDYTSEIRKPDDTITTADKWYGAQYYSIIPVNTPQSPYYVLLGWKGNTSTTTFKVIEVLSFKDGKPVFGMPVFDGDREHAKSARIIFRYSKMATMNLTWDPKTRSIIFDHLSSSGTKATAGNYETYGPDLTYDAFRLTASRWRLVEDLPLKNPPSSNDPNYNNPRKPIKGITRKL